MEATEVMKLATALMAARQCSVIPLGPTKRPTRPWKQWQTRTPTAAEVREWSESTSLALLTGAISGVVVVDCESPADAAWCLSALMPTPCIVRTRRGYHLYYRHPGERVRNAIQVRDRYDVRGDGGYVVAPGAEANGHRYEWQAGSLADLERAPVFDPSWLPVSVAANREPPAMLAEPHDVVFANDRVMRRALRYLETCEPAIEGSGGRKQTFKVGAALTRDFGLTVDQAWSLMLTTWNPGCDPPWDPEQLFREVQGAADRGTHPVGRNV